MADRMSFWAWGLESEEPTDESRDALAERLSQRFGTTITAKPVPDLADAELRRPRVEPPESMAAFCFTDTYERARHSYGAHFTDRTRAFNLDFPNPPDVVAHPRTEAEVEAVLGWCHDGNHAVVPYGGGSSVVWGVEPPPEADTVVTVALDRLDQVLEIDATSRAARIQAGTYGPSLEAQLKPSGHTLRHFPQSFRYSTLGGWIATRSGGHYATNHTHIDDLVESVRMLTPQGWWESRRLPGSGAGPSPDRMVIGSEGILGIITEAWMRIQARPAFRATAGVVFDTWEAGTDAVRQIVQAKLWPANLRILDPVEASRAAGLDGNQALVIIGFESAELSQRGAIHAAVDLARSAGGHYATNHTHIDDLVESVRMLTPQGWWESRRLPGSGAGPSPDRMVIGSEGILGIITEAWMRIQARPTFRATAGVVFDTWEAGADAVRQIVQAKLWPANLRILDPVEASRAAGLDGNQALVIIGFESAELSQRGAIIAAVDIARGAGGHIADDAIVVDDGTGTPTGRGGAVGKWRDSFVGVDPGTATSMGVLADTFETAITWDRWPEFDATVRARMGEVLREVCAHGELSCRFTHVYPDGPAPYYTWTGLGRPGSEISMWQEVKSAANEVVVGAGGTVTHHHAVGRMHRPDGYDRQRPELFAAALGAVKRTLDPNGILNPGVLIDP